MFSGRIVHVYLLKSLFAQILQTGSPLPPSLHPHLWGIFSGTLFFQNKSSYCIRMHREVWAHRFPFCISFLGKLLDIPQKIYCYGVIVVIENPIIPTATSTPFLKEQQLTNRDKKLRTHNFNHKLLFKIKKCVNVDCTKHSTVHTNKGIIWCWGHSVLNFNFRTVQTGFLPLLHLTGLVSMLEQLCNKTAFISVIWQAIAYYYF